ncbi:MAG TPA: hypothetical protein VL098_06205 [Flavipsychrobacter sp.]|nr:hypothetical protein [Flavipsychrobacter sp.]
MKTITDKQINILFVVANVITQVLFFIDEGYNDFRWMKEPGNWLVYLIYILIIFGTLLGLLYLYVLIRKAVHFIRTAWIKR